MYKYKDSRCRKLTIKFDPIKFSRNYDFKKNLGIFVECPIGIKKIDRNLLLRSFIIYKNGIPEDVKGKGPAEGEYSSFRKRARDEEIEYANKRIKQQTSEFINNVELPNVISLDNTPSIEQINNFNRNNEDVLEVDNGEPYYFYFNGKEVKFTRSDYTEAKSDPGDFIFYWNRHDDLYGVRYRKDLNNKDEDNIGSGSGNKEEMIEKELDQEISNEEGNVAAPFLHKYIAIAVLGDSETMVPQDIVIQTSSKFELCRFRYTEEDIKNKEQVAVSNVDMKKVWNNRNNNFNNYESIVFRGNEKRKNKKRRN